MRAARPLTRFCIALWVAGLPAILGQTAESRPASRGESDDLQAAMAQLRGGKVDYATVRFVVDGLARTGHTLAVPWWIALAEESLAGRELSTRDRDALTRLKRGADRPDSFPEERKLMLRLVRHSESLIA